MLEAGFLDEVAALRERSGVEKDLPAMRAVGYRQAWEYLEGATSGSEMRERAVAATRQLAKRQLTWLRSWDDVHIVDPQTRDPLGASLHYLDAVAIVD